MIPTPERILILKPSSLGDIIHTLPALFALRHYYPAAKISWLVKHEWAEILEEHPDLDEVISAEFHLRYWPSLVSRVRQGQFDLVIDLQGLFRTGLLAGLSGAPVRIGFAAGREGSPWFYTHRVKLPISMDRSWRLLDIHAVERNLAIIRFLGAEISRPTFSLPDRESDVQNITQWIHDAGVKDHDRVVAIAPLSRAEIKCWPLERFIEVSQMLSRWYGCKIILLGSPTQRWMVDKFSEKLNGQFIDMVGKLRIRQIGTLLRRTKLLIANDSAPVHIGVAVGTSVLAILGPTHPGATGPYGSGLHRVLNGKLPCQPCGKQICHHVNKKECLTEISVKQVLEAATDMLNASEIVIGRA